MDQRQRELFLELEHPRKPVRRIGTSLTMEYRKEMWGLERLVLDAVQNHLPADCGGSRTDVLVVQQSQARPFDNLLVGAPADAIIFADDGKGYPSELLSVLYSTKAPAGTAAGMFGEGSKLLAAAAIRDGVDLEFRSQDWVAKPFSYEQRLPGRELRRLGYDIARTVPIKGSRTIIRRPDPSLLGQVLAIPQNVLHFSRTYCELDRAEEGAYAPRILASDEPNLFVKGVIVQRKIPALFSYDLAATGLAPDRNAVADAAVLAGVRRLLTTTTNPQVIEKVLSAAHDDPYRSALEYRALAAGSSAKTPSAAQAESAKLWQGMFAALFGADAVLQSDLTQYDEDARGMGHPVIKLNHGVMQHLHRTGVQFSSDLFTNNTREWVPLERLKVEERGVADLRHRLAAELYKALPFTFAPYDFRVYGRVLDKRGRLLPRPDEGVYLGAQALGEGRTPIIGVYRPVLADPYRFADTFIEELDHHVTQSGDYSRKFYDFVLQRLSRTFVDRIRNSSGTSRGS